MNGCWSAFLNKVRGGSTFCLFPEMLDLLGASSAFTQEAEMSKMPHADGAARGAVDPRRPRGATGGRGSLASASLEAAAAQPRRRIGHLGCWYEPHFGWGCVRRPCAAANGFLEWLLCFRVLFEPEEMWECYLFSLGASKKWL